MLVDVLAVAQRVISQCPMMTKLGLGGAGQIGGRKGFFVSVNGRAFTGVVRGANVTRPTFLLGLVGNTSDLRLEGSRLTI